MATKRKPTRKTATTKKTMVIEHRLHLTQWQRLESGKGISTPSLLRICEVFDVGLSQFVGDLGQVDRNAEAVAEPMPNTGSVDPLPAKNAGDRKNSATRSGK